MTRDSVFIGSYVAAVPDNYSSSKRWCGQIVEGLTDSGSYLAHVTCWDEAPADFYKIVSIHQMSKWRFYADAAARDEEYERQPSEGLPLNAIAQEVLEWLEDIDIAQFDMEHAGEMLHESWQKWKKAKRDAAERLETA